MNDKERFRDVNEYIASFPQKTAKLLRSLRSAIRKSAPDSQETISYNMPAYKLKGMLLYFAAYKNHIGFYPMASAIKVFGGKLTKYKCSKGTVQFPLDKPLPVKLIAEIVEFRVQENLAKAEKKKQPQPKSKKKS